MSIVLRQQTSANTLTLVAVPVIPFDDLTKHCRTNDRLFLGTNLGRDAVGRGAATVEGTAAWMEAETVGELEMGDTVAPCGDLVETVLDVMCLFVEI